MTITLGKMVRLDEPFDQAMARTREALKAEGFGVLTEIDIQAAFREKLDREFNRYVILGACNPSLAYRALSAAPEVGLLLPCNVTIESEPGGGTVVRLVDPLSLLGTGELTALPELAAVAAEAHGRLERVSTALESAARDR
jgi:uncharacterized protein (DUF302 family)